MQSITGRQLELSGDERLRIVDPTAKVARRGINVGEDVTDEHAILVLDHWRTGDDPHVGQLPEWNRRARLTPLFKEIGRRLGATNRRGRL